MVICTRIWPALATPLSSSNSLKSTTKASSEVGKHSPKRFGNSLDAGSLGRQSCCSTGVILYCIAGSTPVDDAEDCGFLATCRTLWHFFPHGPACHTRNILCLCLCHLSRKIASPFSFAPAFFVPTFIALLISISFAFAAFLSFPLPFDLPSLVFPLPFFPLS